MRPLQLGVLASGRGSNFEAIAKNCAEEKINAKVAILLSDNSEAKALERAKTFGIEARFVDPGHFKTKLTPEAEEMYVKILKEHNVELVILAGFMRILKTHFLRSFAGRIINIHPALLPSFPGLHGQKQAFDYGVKVSGCTVHFVDEGVDTGPIILQRAVPVLEDDTAETLAARILQEEHKIYSEAIQLFAEGRLKIVGRRVKILPKR
ncbi:MAG TPA: phosphoribosylglycinamide formyltransferase [bacterium (Candidatus Stahlbacteria)]|nr:phosphoribosylglycinamide formyltransferase [Candidatus Stahlbacteria bacterium]